MVSPDWPKEDPILRIWVERITPFSFESTNQVFHDLVSCVVEQQIHYRSTKNIFKRLLVQAGLEQLTVENFPIFEEKALSFCTISQKKLETLAVLHTYFSTHTHDWANLSDDEVRTILKSISGIGSWTQEMILLFTLQRENAFPIDDFHLQQMMVSLYNLDAKTRLKAQMKRVTEKWEGNSALACLYLWEIKRHNNSLKVRR